MVVDNPVAMTTIKAIKWRTSGGFLRQRLVVVANESQQLRKLGIYP